MSLSVIDDLLGEKSAAYVSSMEQPSLTVNYDAIETDRLLILEALNDWSGRILAEGGELRLTYNCDDPCCATSEEAAALVRRMHEAPVVLYPVSGFSLSDEDALKFSWTSSAFRMVPHVDSSRASGIGVAESKRIGNVDAGMRLWVQCATEDCMAYLAVQMESHGLFLETEEHEAVKRIVTSSVQERYSIGQVWNAMWRTVKDVAALSTKQFFNHQKAAKTLPKKLDKILLNAASDVSFAAYERLAATPPGAVLTLFRSRFGIEDSTPGSEVRFKLEADAKLAPPAPSTLMDLADAPAVSRTRGVMFFTNELTDFDRVVLSHFDGLNLDTEAPTWAASSVTGRLSFSLSEYYGFRSWEFKRVLLGLLNLEDSANAVGTAALCEALTRAGASAVDASLVSERISGPLSPTEVVALVSHLPWSSSLCGIRVESVDVSAEHVCYSDELAVGDFSFSIPTKASTRGLDRDAHLVSCMLVGDTDGMADDLCGRISSLLYCHRPETRAELLRAVARRLLAHVDA